MTSAVPEAARLAFRELSPADVVTFHELAVDPHVRRFLLDGEIVSRDWAAAAVETSRASFAQRGLGLWLLSDQVGCAAPCAAEPIGFAGF